MIFATTLKTFPSLIATKELEGFLALFDLVKLGTDHIDIDEVMKWYDRGAAPFGEGRKKSEFPDAFALSSLLTFAKKHGETVAVISSDGDFQNASALYDCLLFYRTPGAYVESLLLSDEHVKKLRAILDSDTEMIRERLEEEFTALAFHAADDEYDWLEDAEVDQIDFTDLSIVGTGDKEASVSFEAEVAFNVYASGMTNLDGWAPDSVRVSDLAYVTGTAKLSLNSDWSVFESIDVLRLDQEEIDVDASPSGWHFSG